MLRRDSRRPDRLTSLLSGGANPNEPDTSGAPPIWHACRAGAADNVRLLISRHACVDVQPPGKHSAIGIASQYGFLDVVQLLLEQGPQKRKGTGFPWPSADLEKADAEATTPLFAACRGGHTRVAEALLAAGANPNARAKPLECTALGWLTCVEASVNTALLELLLRHRADVDARFEMKSMTPLAFAVIVDRHDAIRWLLAHGAGLHEPDSDGDAPLLLACLSDHPESCRLLLDAKANANSTSATGRTVLNVAAHGESVECVQQLLTAGAAATIDHMDERGTHPMHWACQDGNAGVLQLLCEAKADVENKNGKGGSPLGLALSDVGQQGDKLACIRILIEHRVDVNAVDRQGLTMLNRACHDGSAEAAELLLRAGAASSISHMDHQGTHPMHWASQNANPRLMQLLVDAKANVEQHNGKGGSPLMLVICDAGAANVECLKILLEAKANPNQLDHEGDPPLIRTMIRDDEGASAALLEAGARADGVDRHGIQLAQRFAVLNKPRMLRLLVQHGALQHGADGVIDLVQTGIASGHADIGKDVLAMLRDAHSIRSKFVADAHAKELAAREAARVAEESRQAEAEERRCKQERAAHERAAAERRATDRATLMAWLQGTCELDADEAYGVAEIFLAENFRTVRSIEALQGRDKGHWPEALSLGHRVSIDETILRSRQQVLPQAHQELPQAAPPLQAPPPVAPLVASALPPANLERVASESSVASRASIVEQAASRVFDPDAEVEDVVAFFQSIKLDK